jgi:hypothetical protein
MEKLGAFSEAHERMCCLFTVLLNLWMLMRKRRAKETHNKGAEKCPLASFK